MDTKQIGKYIANLRKSQGYTQETLAAELGISAQAVSKWETGTGLPEASLLLSLSKLFRVGIDELLCNPYSTNTIEDFMLHNLCIPESKSINGVPRISRWNPPEGCDMFYSMPAMMAQILCYTETYEQGASLPVPMSALNERFCDLMHYTGIAYGFLWEDDRHVIEELWRVHDYADMIERVMRFYGRNYLWLTSENSTPDQMRRAMCWSINRGHPVMAEFVGGLPEFSVITGYENSGNTVIGVTYCEECAARMTDEGFFVNPARWDENFDMNMLIPGDKCEPVYTEKDSIAFALEMLTQSTPVHRDYRTFKFTSGDDALRMWLDACDTYERAHDLFFGHTVYAYALMQNTIYTQKCLQSHLKKISVNYNREVAGVIIQIGIAIDRITSERNGLASVKDDRENFLPAARAHIQHMLDYRGYLRGWLGEMYELM